MSLNKGGTIMYLMKPGWKTTRMGLTPWEEVDGKKVLQTLEIEGRRCYKSEGRMTEDSCYSFMKNRLSGKIKHTALLDHLHITAEYICDRGVSHEWLRHKLTEILPSGCVQELDDFTPMAVCQESTRYCNYMKSGGVCFIMPPWINIPEGNYFEYGSKEYYNFLNSQYVLKDGYILNNIEILWFNNALYSEYTYLEMLKNRLTPQEARGELLIKVKTEFSVTCSITEWRHIMNLRTDSAAHPQMKEVMRPQLEEFKRKIPILFDDI